VYPPQSADIARPYWEYQYTGDLNVPYQDWDGNAGAICQSTPEDGPHQGENRDTHHFRDFARCAATISYRPALPDGRRWWP